MDTWYNTNEAEAAADPDAAHGLAAMQPKLSYVFQCNQICVKATGGDKESRTAAMNQAYDALRGFTGEFGKYMVPNRCDGLPQGDLECVMHQTGGPQPEITIKFCLDPSLPNAMRKGIQRAMETYVGTALGVPACQHRIQF